MSSIGAGYDFAVTTYSPDGRLYQVEYADKAVENAGTSIGIQCKDGVVIGAETIVKSKLLEESSTKAIHYISKNIGFTFAGWAPDTRKIISHSRDEVKSFQDLYGTEMSGKVMADKLSSFVHSYTIRSWLRPFGCSTIIAAHDRTRGYELFMVDPSGNAYSYSGVAVGKAKQTAKNELSKLNISQMTCRDAVKAVVSILNECHDSVKDKEFHCELGWVCDESKGLFQRVPQELVKEALRDLEKDVDMEDEDQNLSDVDD